jgi:hypothetical protein
MADASVTAIDGRAVVRVGGSELLDAYIGQALVAGDQAAASAAAAAGDADDAAQSAALAQTAALTAPNVFADEAAGRTAVANGQTFWTDLGDAGLGLYRRTSSTVSALIGKVVTGAMLASASGSALISHSVAAIGSIVRPVQAVLRDQAFNPKDFGAIGDAQAHPLSERFATLAAAQALYPFVTSLTQTQDWVGIQAALNAASANANIRGAVRLPIGYYVLSNSLQLPSFVTFEGMSRHGCVLYNQVVALAAPMIVNKDSVSLVFSTVRNLTFYGGTHAIKINVSVETASLIFESLNTALQTVSVLEANSLQATVFRDCQFGTPESGYAVNVTGFPCNAVEFYNCRVSSGASGVLKLRGFDGVHWYGGSMEGNGRSLKATGSVAGSVLTVTALNDGLGPISVGDAVIADGITAGTVVVSRGTGTGGTGTYNLNYASTAASRPLIIGPATIDLDPGGTRATSITFNGVYFEGTPRLLLRTVNVQGVSFDACKHTWATDGEPYIYDTGTDVIAIGTNHFDKDVIGPLNMLMFGATPRIGGNVNVWTSQGQNAGKVITRQHDLAASPTFDVLAFNRATATAGAGNMHLITGTLTVLAQGYDSGGAPRSINRSYRVLISAVSNSAMTATITQTDTQDNVSGTTPQTLLARVKAAPGTTELRIEVVTTNFDTTLASACSAVFEYGGRPTNQADMIRVSAA